MRSCSPLRLPVGVAVLAALATLSLPAPAVSGLHPVAEERALDRPVDCGSTQPSLAALQGGGFAAAWSDGATLWWRRLDATGEPLGAATPLATGEPLAPKVVPRSDGGFAVAWFDASAARARLGTVTPDGLPGYTFDLGTLEPGAPFQGLDATLSPGGSVAVVWAGGEQLYFRELLPDGNPGSGPISLIFEPDVLPPPVLYPLVFDPAVVGTPDGSFYVFYVAAGFSDGVGMLEGLRLGPAVSGSYPAPVAVATRGTGIDREPAVAAAPDGGFLLAWAGDFAASLPILPIPIPVLLASRYDAQGTTGAEAEQVDTSFHSYRDVAVTAAAGGRFVVGWEGTHGLDASRPFAFATTVDDAGRPEGAPVALAGPASWGQAHPALASGAGGLVVATWQDVVDPDIVFVACPGQRIRARAFTLGCGEDGMLCVGGGRFALSLRYFDFDRGIPDQPAAGAPLTADTAYFWFGSPDNVEVIVKVLDGRALNGHFWVFYGGLTDLGFELTVRDLATGRERVFRNLPGTMASDGVTDALPATAADLAAAADVRAFRTAGLARDAFPAPGAPPAPTPRRAAGSAAGVGPVGAGPGVAPLTPPPPPGPCRDPARPGLCLNGGRFNFIVDWRSFDGSTGVGHGVPLGDDSGYFWFFDPDNVELVVKALDGRAVNGKYWVFYGALTNVEYSIGVWHVVDSAWDLPTVHYQNPLGHFASVADVDAFEPPACTCPAVEDPVCGRDGKTYGSPCLAYCVGWVEIAHTGACAGN